MRYVLERWSPAPVADTTINGLIGAAQLIALRRLFGDDAAGLWPLAQRLTGSIQQLAVCAGHLLYDFLPPPTSSRHRCRRAELSRPDGAGCRPAY
jgi:hypothetical protein